MANLLHRNKTPFIQIHGKDIFPENWKLMPKNIQLLEHQLIVKRERIIKVQNNPLSSWELVMSL